MRIQSITVSNFKSLVNFDLDLAKFTCLIGLNGAGKSTVLQFMDFLAQQVRGDVKGWLAARHWKPRELTSRLTGKKSIKFSAALELEQGVRLSWAGRFNTTQLHCTYERIATPHALLVVEDGHLRIRNRADGDAAWKDAASETIAFSYQGSVLSQLRPRTLPRSLVGFRDYIAGIKNLGHTELFAIGRRAEVREHRWARQSCESVLPGRMKLCILREPAYRRPERLVTMSEKGGMMHVHHHHGRRDHRRHRCQFAVARRGTR